MRTPTGSISTHARPPTRLQRLYYSRENCSQVYETGCNYDSLPLSLPIMAEMGREEKLCSPFTFQRHKALLRWRGEHVPRVLLPSVVHRQAPSVTYSLPLTHRLWLLSLKVSQSPFLMHPSLSFFDCLSGPDHITVTVAMISAFSDRCICFCHSQWSSLAPSLLPDLSQGGTTGKHGQRYLILLHAEDTIEVENGMFSTFK